MTSNRRNRTTASGPRIRKEGGRSIVSARHAGDLAGLVPALIGHRPEDSVVVVAFRGKRTHGAFRIDRYTGAGSIEEWASAVTGPLCRVDGVTGVAVLLYTGETFAPSGRPPGADQVRAVARRARRMGFEVKDQIVVAADGFGSLLDPDLPRGGRPIAEITDLGEEFRPDGRAQLPEVRDVSLREQEAFADHFEAWWTRAEGPGGTLHGVRLQRYRSAFGRRCDPPPAMERYRFGGLQQDVVELVERMLDDHQDSDSPCPCRALLASFAEREGLNGLLLVQWAFGRTFGAEVLAGVHRADRAVADRLGRALGGEHVRPDVERIEKAIAFVADTAACLPPELRGPLDSMLAWLFWAKGVGSVAATLVQRATATGRPGLDLARMVGRFTDARQLPAWAFHPDPAADETRELLAG